MMSWWQRRHIFNYDLIRYKRRSEECSMSKGWGNEVAFQKLLNHENARMLCSPSFLAVVTRAFTMSSRSLPQEETLTAASTNLHALPGDTSFLPRCFPPSPPSFLACITHQAWRNGCNELEVDINNSHNLIPIQYNHIHTKHATIYGQTNRGQLQSQFHRLLSKHSRI